MGASWSRSIARRLARLPPLAGCILALAYLPPCLNRIRPLGTLEAARRAPRRRESPDDDSLMVSVMSFNLRYDNADDRRQGRCWQDRRAPSAALIASTAADIIGTQEGLSHQLRDLQDALTTHGATYGYVGAARDLVCRWLPAGEHCAVFYNQSSVECLGHGTFALSSTPGRLGSKSWGTACPRIATYAWFRVGGELGAGGATGPAAACILHLNTHLDHRSQEARALASRLIVSRVAELEAQETPDGCGELAGSIITGDFNCQQRGPGGGCEGVFAEFQAAGFHDACAESSGELVPLCTFHGWRPGAHARAVGPPASHRHIDWILWRGERLEQAGFEVATGGCFSATGAPPPSDHFPVVARFRVSPAEGEKNGDQARGVLGPPSP